MIQLYPAARITDVTYNNQLPAIKGYELWALGMAVVFGGHFFGWNIGVNNGFGSYVIALLIVSVGHCFLSCCLAELMSIFPFSGKPTVCIQYIFTLN